MIQVNGENRRVVKMACGTWYRHTPVIKPLDSGYVPYSWQGITVNREQLIRLVRKYYLEGK